MEVGFYLLNQVSQLNTPQFSRESVDMLHIQGGIHSSSHGIRAEIRAVSLQEDTFWGHLDKEFLHSPVCLVG
jgi:hypothetical protein